MMFGFTCPINIRTVNETVRGHPWQHVGMLYCPVPGDEAEKIIMDSGLTPSQRLCLFYHFNAMWPAVTCVLNDFSNILHDRYQRSSVTWLQGINVRKRAGDLAALLFSNDKINEEREKVRNQDVAPHVANMTAKK